MITSTSNPFVKDLVRLKSRRQRDASGRFVIEGKRTLKMAIANGVAIETEIVSPELGAAPIGSDHDVVELAEAPFRKVSIRQNPDGHMALAHHLDTGLERIGVGDDATYLVVEAVEKPGNLGAMLRTADASGVDGVIVADPTTDIHNPNVVRASQGALFSVPVAVAATADVLEWLEANDIDLIAATPEADGDYWQTPWGPAVAIAIGTEAEGLSPSMKAAATATTRIPMAGSVDSLNASVSAALLLYEVARRRDAQSA